jgi:hypothetical protein
LTKSILVPVASEGQGSHLGRAVWLARRSDAEVILLCVRAHRDYSDEDELERARLGARRGSAGARI